jgi:hypothetical protein
MQTRRPYSCEFGDALGGHDHACLEMHFEAVVMRVWRPQSSELGHVLAGSGWSACRVLGLFSSVS